MHSLLKRQIRKLADGDVSRIPKKFLQAIDLAYQKADEDRLLLEHSMDLTSAELLERNQELRQQISERQEAFAALEATLDAVTDGVLVADLQRRTSSHNRKFLEVFGHQELDMENGDRGIEKAAYLVPNPTDFLARIQAIYENSEGSSFDILSLVDGRIFERTSAPQRIGDRTVGRVWCFRDITERRALELQTQHSQKMDAVGRLAGGIAHDFNNLLTVIQGFCDVAGRNLAQGEHETVQGHVDQIERAAKRGAELTSKLLALSRQQRLEVSSLELNQVLADIRQILDRVVDESIELQVETSAHTATIQADSGSLEQVILNLAINARDAMPAGGMLRLAVSTHGRPGEEGSRVELSVSDTGTGIPEQDLPNIFEPFFTTKELGRGTGLGLATASGIVEQSGGSIGVESSLGIGTTFRISFPWSDQPIYDSNSELSTSTWDGAAENVNILLVEDDPTVRLILVETLRFLGYSILEAESPTVCLDRFRDQFDQIDLLITDVVMPKISGFELADRLTRENPQMRVLYVSGYDPEARNRFGKIGETAGFLPKPFDTESLARKVREVLSRRCSSARG